MTGIPDKLLEMFNTLPTVSPLLAVVIPVKNTGLLIGA